MGFNMSELKVGEEKGKPKVLIAGNAYERRLLAGSMIALANNFPLRHETPKEQKVKWTSEDVKNSVLRGIK